MTNRKFLFPAARVLLFGALPLITQAGCAADPSDSGGSSAGTSGVTFSNGYGMGDGLKGYWYTYSDAKDKGASIIKPECGDSASATCFSSAGRKICASGTAGKVQMGLYGQYWGAGVGWNLNQENSPPNPAKTVSLKGKKAVTVTLDMKTKSPMRLKLKVSGDNTDYCANVEAGENKVPLSKITKECWMEGGEAISPEANVVALQFQIPTNADSDVSFDFCVTKLSFK